MNMQRQIFCASEGDEWHRRNSEALAERDYSVDPVCREISKLGCPSGAALLEIGCGDGTRLKYLQDQYGLLTTGIDPSRTAIDVAQSRGLDTVVGTAESLPFEDKQFDVVVFGFCLYLCDDVDLFRIAAEADRVLKSPGWLLILDFDAAQPTYRKYHHREGIECRKMKYKSMFNWHPSYTLASLDKFHHNNLQWTDDPNEWVSLATLRKTSRTC